jgi:hypothetical protein
LCDMGVVELAVVVDFACERCGHGFGNLLDGNSGGRQTVRAHPHFAIGTWEGSERTAG